MQGLATHFRTDVLLTSPVNESPLGREGDKRSLSPRARSPSTRTHEAPAKAGTPFRVEGDTQGDLTLNRHPLVRLMFNQHTSDHGV